MDQVPVWVDSSNEVMSRQLVPTRKVVKGGGDFLDAIYFETTAKPRRRTSAAR